MHEHHHCCHDTAADEVRIPPVGRKLQIFGAIFLLGGIIDYLVPDGFIVRLLGFFGWKATYFVVGAMAVAVITGYVFMILDRFGLIDESSPLPRAYRGIA